MVWKLFSRLFHTMEKMFPHHGKLTGQRGP
jgi:hypothetical protein